MLGCDDIDFWVFIFGLIIGRIEGRLEWMVGLGFFFRDIGDIFFIGIGICNVCSCLVLFFGCGIFVDLLMVFGLGDVFE